MSCIESLNSLGSQICDLQYEANHLPVGPTGPAGPVGLFGFSGSYTTFVDPVYGNNSTGSFTLNFNSATPFLTIQGALNKIPTTDTTTPIPVNASSIRKNYVIFISPGQYDESLTVNLFGTKKVALIGWGPFTIGLFNGSGGVASNARNITINVGAGTDSIRSAFSMGTIIPLGDARKNNQFGMLNQVSGRIVFGAITGRLELLLENTVLHGFGTTECLTYAAAQTSTSTSSQMYLRNCAFLKNFGATTATPQTLFNFLQYAELCKFVGVFFIRQYSTITQSVFLDDLTIAAAAADFFPNSMMENDFSDASDVNNVSGIFRIDGATNYNYTIQHGNTVPAPAVKVIHDNITP